MPETYKFDDETLKDIIEKERKFKLVLPHFQRKFVWKVEDQKALLQSMLSGIPVGGILLLDDKKDSYDSRPLCFDFEPNIEGDRCTFLLDGQQRVSTMKSMFYDLFSKKEIERFDDVDNWKDLLSQTPGKLSNRWFLKISKNDEDIFGLKSLSFDEDKQLYPSDFEEFIDIRKILKTKNAAYYPNDNNKDLVNWSVQNMSVPLCLIADDRYSFKEVLKRIAADEHGEAFEARRVEEWAESIVVFIEERTLKTDIHEILLGENGMRIGISIFEQVNRGGVKLDVYDLIVARMAFHKKNLTYEIGCKVKNVQAIMSAISNDTREGFDIKKLDVWNDKDSIPSNHFKKSFKNCLAITELNGRKQLESLKDKYIKERNLLDLDQDQINDNWEETIDILFSVLQFLHFRCGVDKLKNIPYELLIVPLFVFFIKHDNKPDKQAIDRIEFWYWSSILSGHYREKQSTRVIQDSKMIIEGKDFNDRLEKIFKEDGYSDKNSLLRKKENGRQPQLDRTLIQYVISKEPFDLKKETKGHKKTKISAYKQAKGDIVTQVHHIIPINELKNVYSEDDLREDKEHAANSMLNKVVISDAANWKIMRIDDYKHHANHLNCKSNCIPQPNDKKYYKGDVYDLNSFESFLSDRFDLLEKDIKEHLIGLISD
ncbi:MAG: DUF262 domain-containing protein [Gammaproteobacteria bacterium]|nr:DUF262 domain-containing protein [Gammaproteobacteria bacterium]